MSSPIRIGIIGCSPDRGWALTAHIPAIRASPDLALKAVSTSRLASAEQVGRALGVPAYDNAEALVSRDDVDLVVISVKVPHHAQLVRAAINARKAVLCEWPLGNGLTESAALAAEAEAANIRHFSGLQARSSPEIAYLRELIADGWIGDVLSSSIIGSGVLWGPVISSADAYVLDRSTGAGMLEIPFAHTLDGACHCLGEIDELTAQMSQRRRSASIMETGHQQPMSVPDQIVMGARFQSGAMLSVHYRGGVSTGTNFLWEINGTKGDITVTADSGLAQMTPLAIFGAQAGEQQKALVVPDRYKVARGSPDGVAVNVAQAYAHIVDDLRDGGSRAPDFRHAVLRHSMLAAIERSAQTGTAQSYL